MESYKASIECSHIPVIQLLLRLVSNIGHLSKYEINTGAIKFIAQVSQTTRFYYWCPFSVLGSSLRFYTALMFIKDTVGIETGLYNMSLNLGLSAVSLEQTELSEVRGCGPHRQCVFVSHHIIPHQQHKCQPQWISYLVFVSVLSCHYFHFILGWFPNHPRLNGKGIQL